MICLFTLYHREAWVTSLLRLRHAWPVARERSSAICAEGSLERSRSAFTSLSAWRSGGRRTISYRRISADQNLWSHRSSTLP